MEVNNLQKPINEVVKKLDGWLEALIQMIPNIGVAILLLIMFFILASLGRKIALKLIRKTSDNEVLNHLFGTISYYVTLAVGFFIILEVLNLSKAVTSLLAGVGILGLALGFAFQEIASNFVAGILLAFRKPFRIDDVVELKGIFGKVSRTNLRVTVVTTFQGQEVYIPNSQVLNNPIYNFSITGKRRIDLSIGISYGEDLRRVEQIVTDTIQNMDGVIDHDKMIFDYYGFGDSSINFNIRFWIEYPAQPSYFEATSRAIKEIKQAFNENGITIPFPIRTLDFGIKGGQKLSEMPIRISNNNHDDSE